MRIAVSGSQKVGKTLFINEFLSSFQMYGTPERTYRDTIAENNLNINTEGDEDGQRAIRDALVDQMTDASDKKYIVHDRCPLDNLAYTLYLANAGRVSDDFVRESLIITSQSVKMLDVIFYCPIKSGFSNIVGADGNPAPANENPNRSDDETFRESIDNIFMAFAEDNAHRKGWVFDPADAPPMIELAGNVAERIANVKNYIDDAGDSITTGINLEEEVTRIKESLPEPSRR